MVAKPWITTNKYIQILINLDPNRNGKGGQRRKEYKSEEYKFDLTRNRNTHTQENENKKNTQKKK